MRITATKCHDGKRKISSTRQQKGRFTAIVYVGINLAKNVFAVHRITETGNPELVRLSVRRALLHELVATLPPCTVAMDTCFGGHHWARLFAAHGHTVRLTASQASCP
jgi:transposase